MKTNTELRGQKFLIDSGKDEKLDKAPGITCFLLVRLSAFHHANISGRGEM